IAPACAKRLWPLRFAPRRLWLAETTLGASRRGADRFLMQRCGRPRPDCPARNGFTHADTTPVMGLALVTIMNGTPEKIARTNRSTRTRTPRFYSAQRRPFAQLHMAFTLLDAGGLGCRA